MQRSLIGGSDPDASLDLVYSWIRFAPFLESGKSPVWVLDRDLLPQFTDAEAKRSKMLTTFRTLLLCTNFRTLHVKLVLLSMVDCMFD